MTDFPSFLEIRKYEKIIKSFYKIDDWVYNKISLDIIFENKMEKKL